MSTEDLMKVLSSIADAVVRLDGQAKYISMNQAAENKFIHLGHDPETMMGHSVWKLFPELMGTMAERELRRVLEDESPIQHEIYYPADQRWYEIQGFPSSPGAIFIFRDITARKAE
ncbi:MAG TPA: PAS domain-containing protein [Nitrospira sp.]|nr:PAS domain-containing protein [Nitrospira sp.]